MLCACGTIHRPRCPNGTSGGGSAPTRVEPRRDPWFCPRCSRMNAPHVDQCSCPPLSPGGPIAMPSPFYPAPGERVLPFENNDGWTWRITLCGEPGFSN